MASIRSPLQRGTSPGSVRAEQDGRTLLTVRHHGDGARPLWGHSSVYQKLYVNGNGDFAYLFVRKRETFCEVGGRQVRLLAMPDGFSSYSRSSIGVRSYASGPAP
jgi:hypothetical protein